MEVQGSSASYAQADVQALVIPVFQGEKTEDGLLKELDKAAGGLVSSVLESEELKGDRKSVV